MATITVKKDGSGDQTTILGGINAASAGDTVSIYDGTYNETGINILAAKSDGLIVEAAAGQHAMMSGNSTTGDIGFYTYGEGTHFNNLEFTGYRYCIYPYATAGYRYHMSGVFAHHVGNVNNDSTFFIAGSATHVSTIDSCKIFSDRGKVFSIQGDYIKFKNCLLVSDDSVASGDAIIDGNLGSYVNTTASFCTIIGSVTGDALINGVAKVTNCIVSGTYLAATPGAAGYVGPNGIKSLESSYNIVSVDGYPFRDNTPADTARGTGDISILNFQPYWTNAGTLGSYNTASDDYTLVRTRTATSIGPPVAYYTMEDGSGTTLTDVSNAGNSRNGTLVNSPTWSTTSKMGTYSLLFDGNNDYATIDSVAQDIAGSDFSICFWMKTTETSNWFVAINTSAGDNRLILGSHSTGQLKLYSNQTYAPASRTDVHDNAWHHVIWTWDQSQYMSSIYVNGILEKQIVMAGTPTVASSDKITIGMEWDAGPAASDFWEGYIDEFAVFDSLLEPEHVLLIYNNGDGADVRCGFGCDVTYLNLAINGGTDAIGHAADLPGRPRPAASGITYTQKILSINSGSANSCMGVLNQSAPDAGAYEYVTGMSEIKKVLDVSN